MKTILVTGSRGFVGVQLVTSLLNAKNYNVIAIDNAITEDVFKHPNLTTYNLSYEKIENVEVDAVVHLGNYKYNDNSQALSFDIVSLPKFIKKFSPDLKFIYASSAAVYDKNYNVKPKTMYGLSKLTQETILLESEFENLSILRFFNIYGNTSNGGVIKHFRDAIENSAPIYINGDGESVRDYIHVSDVVDSIIKEIESEQIGIRIKNIGTGIGTSLNDLAYTLFEVLGKETKVIYNYDGDCGIKSSIAPNPIPVFLSLKDGIRDFQIDKC